MPTPTEYHGLDRFEADERPWSHTDTVETVDEELPKSGLIANRPADPPAGRRYWATDERVLYQYDPDHTLAEPSGWVPLSGLGTATAPVPGTLHVEGLTVDGDATVATGPLDVGDTRLLGTGAIRARNGRTLHVMSEGSGTGRVSLWDAANDQHVLQALEGGDVQILNGDLILGGSSSGISHTDLGDVTSNDHHTRYVDEEAQDAIGTILSAAFSYDDTTPAIDMAPHVATADAHHAKTQPSEVTSANWGDYELQKDGTDGMGVINFKTT